MPLRAWVENIGSMASTDTISIRRATAHHADGVLECLRAAFAPYEHHYSAAGYEDTVLTGDAFLLRLGEMAIFVALDFEGRVIGTIGCKKIGQTEGHLRGMAVRPECQARGIADRLLKFAEAELARQNCSRITLDTTEPLQGAMRFYERHGYRRSGAVRDFFGMPLIEYVKQLAPNR